MAFKATLVARPEDPSAAPYLGHPLTEIDLLQPNGESAARPVVTAPESRDRIIEGVTGSDVAVNRRKLVELDLEIDFIDSATKGKIDRLYHDGRPLLLCPNFGQETKFSLPLQRSVEDITERHTMDFARTGVGYTWDEDDQVMRSWATDEPMLSFNGHWTRYFSSQVSALNQADAPHPTSGAFGWVTASGSPVLAYSEGTPTPVLDQRGVTNGKGVVHVFAPAGGAAVKHNAATISNAFPIAAHVLIKADGDVSAQIKSTGGMTYATNTYTANGKWQMIRVNYDNAAALVTCDLVVTPVDSLTVNQVVIIGPTFIGNSFGDFTAPDWANTSNTTPLLTDDDGLNHDAPAISISCFLRRVTGSHQHILFVDGTEELLFGWDSSDAINVFNVASSVAATFPSVGSGFSIADGDWVHLVMQGSIGGDWELFVNGVAHADNGTQTFHAGRWFDNITVGYYNGSGSTFPAVQAGLSHGGLSHLRMDGRPWTATEVLDHYHTYFDVRGRGVIEPLFGKVLHIEDYEMSPRTISAAGAGDIQWVGNIVLRELGPDTDFAPLIRQEGDV